MHNTRDLGRCSRLIVARSDGVCGFSWLRVLLVSWTFAGIGFLVYALYLVFFAKVTKRVRGSIAAAARAQEERQQARQSWTPLAEPQRPPPPPPPPLPPPAYY